MTIRNYSGDAFKTITVAELIERLQGEDPDAQVVFSTCYGDYHRTQQALPIHGEFEEQAIEKSAYSNSGFALADEDDDDDDDDDDEPRVRDTNPRVLVIR